LLFCVDAQAETKFHPLLRIYDAVRILPTKYSSIRAALAYIVALSVSDNASLNAVFAFIKTLLAGIVYFLLL